MSEGHLIDPSSGKVQSKYKKVSAPETTDSPIVLGEQITTIREEESSLNNE